MNKKIILIGVFTVIFLIVSNATAVPQTNSKQVINLLEQKTNINQLNNVNFIEIIKIFIEMIKQIFNLIKYILTLLTVLFVKIIAGGISSLFGVIGKAISGFINICEIAFEFIILISASFLNLIGISLIKIIEFLEKLIFET